MRPLLHATALACALAVLPGGAARGQFIRPGSGLQEEETRTVVTLLQDSEESLWRLGPFRVTPVLGLQDLRYDSTAASPTSDQEGDVTATFAAGFDAYLPLGSKSVFSFSAVPAYTYWVEFSEQNRFVGSYGASLLGDFNRARISFAAGQREDLEIVSPELLQRPPQERQDFRAELEIDLARSLALYIEAGEQRTRLDEPEPGFDPGLDTLRRLDRDETRVRAGLLFHSDERFELGIGLQREVNDFSTADRANEGDSPYLTLRLEGNRLEASIDLAQRSLEPRDGSAFQTVDDVTGTYRLTLSPGWRISYSVYGGRYILYSLSEEQSHLEDERMGLGLGIELSPRASLELWGEEGELRYNTLPGALPVPNEDISAWGGSLAVQVSDRSQLSLRGGHVEFDSPLPGADREWNFFMTGFSITLSRVRIDVGTGG